MGAEKWLDIELWETPKECFKVLKTRVYRIATNSFGNGHETSDGRYYTRLAQAFDPNPAETVRINGKSFYIFANYLLLITATEEMFLCVFIYMNPLAESESKDGFKDTFQMMEKDDYLCSSSGPPSVEWKRVMDRCLIDLMLEQVNRGNKVGETFTEQAWAEIYILMMRERDDINNILNLDGFVWDGEKQTIVAEDEHWEAYIKEHPDATMFKDKTLDGYGDLCKLYEHLSQEGFNCENLMIELDNYGHEIDIVDENFSSSTHKQYSSNCEPTQFHISG
ncbi:unnamed protein product [Eruca vesicaria subsp. sativa]|uniref:Myb/SANT-like domain-containing protein n=1 Tax=Eruca vesicaria subsp. sativa TaxID=29727 RepID=A0ABC8JGS8_ERUVS|nr:unnamed protein product [Eruca vesicaria subsp. sativa]